MKIFLVILLAFSTQFSYAENRNCEDQFQELSDTLKEIGRLEGRRASGAKRFYDGSARRVVTKKLSSQDIARLVHLISEKQSLLDWKRADFKSECLD